MDLFEVLAVISDWLFANASKTYILLRWLLHKISTLPRRCQGFRRSGSRRRRRGKYARCWRPFAKLSRWIRGWILDALVILGGSAVLAVMCVSFFG